MTSDALACPTAAPIVSFHLGQMGFRNTFGCLGTSLIVVKPMTRIRPHSVVVQSLTPYSSGSFDLFPSWILENCRIPLMFTLVAPRYSRRTVDHARCED